MGGSLSSSTSYDSTWEEDEDDDSSVVTEQPSASSTDAIYPKAQEIPRNTEKKRKEYKYMYCEAAQDMQAYRHRFQPSMSNYQDSPDEMPNLMFYKNQMECKPDGLYIEDLLEDWKDKYEILEKNHYYIQWLFPLRQPGKNPHAVPLHQDEIEMMKNDKDVKKRLCEAYKLMLGFYGLQLLDESTGRVGQAENWQERYRNLNSHSHNNNRIARILMCLGEMGFEHYQVPLIRFFLEETLQHGVLKNVKRSVLDYFIFSVRDKKERRELLKFAREHYEPNDKFIWGPMTSSSEKETSCCCFSNPQIH